MRLIDADCIKYTKCANGDIVVSKEEIQKMPITFELYNFIYDIRMRLQERIEYYGSDYNLESDVYKEILEEIDTKLIGTLRNTDIWPGE